MNFSKIRTWALIAVAVTSAALIGLSYWLVGLLSQPEWCTRAIGASQYVEGRPEYAVGGCFTLLQQQVSALALNSHISIGVLALCLAVLVVIVLAGGRLSFSASRDGVNADIQRDAAQEVADAAQDEADTFEKPEFPR